MIIKSLLASLYQGRDLARSSLLLDKGGAGGGFVNVPQFLILEVFSDSR